MNLKNKTVMVVDNGLFVDFARSLAKEFGKVLYHIPGWRSAAPTTRSMAVGTGFDEIERVDFFFDHIDEVDLFVFLDLYHADLQTFLERQGKRVWGPRWGEELELDRWQFKNYLERIGLPVKKGDKVIGVDSLRKLLQSVDDKYIKTSFVRGDFETFKHDSAKTSEMRLDEITSFVGPFKKQYEFIVDDPIDAAVEVGYDGFTVDGKFPSHAMMGYEVKDCGMVGVVKEYSKLAEPVKLVNEKLAPGLREHSYRGFLATEIRYTKKKEAYFIDPCCRLGTPSNELLRELFEEWGQTLWEGADGNVSTPKSKAKYAVGAVLKSPFAEKGWLAVEVPKEIRQCVSLRYSCLVDGALYTVPQTVGLCDIGMVTASGATLEEAFGKVKEYADQLKGFQLEVSLGSLDKAMEVIQKGESMGIRFLEGGRRGSR